MREEVTRLAARMDAGLATLRADMAKWLFGMWMTLLGAMIALVKLG